MCDILNIELFLNLKILNEYNKISMILSGRVFVSRSWRNIDENHCMIICGFFAWPGNTYF